MGISVFPPVSGDGGVTNDFVVDLNNTTNNVAELGRQFIAGSYSLQFSSGDTSYDIYLIDANGSAVGYSNSSSIVASDGFETVVILGVDSTEIVTFTFAGAVADVTAEGTQPGAGAYLVSINPSDLPTADDTANVIGGNFSTAVQLFFESGTVSLPAKNIVRSNSTALVVTRPDAFDPALDPWSVRAINPGVIAPTGSNVHILPGTVTAGALPVFETTSPLPTGTATFAYAGTVVATDADGPVTYSITTGSLPAGLAFNGATGVISGTPTAGGSTFTVKALDDGGNFNTREFELPVVLAAGGSVSSVGNYTVHTFNTSGNFESFVSITDAEYIILGGGGGGGASGNSRGGGGGGGLLASITGFSSGSATSALAAVTLSPGTFAVAIGAGGAASSQGGSSSLATVGTAIGGGAGGNATLAGSSGGSGGGSGGNSAPGGLGTSGQGQSGVLSTSNRVGGGGGGTFSTPAWTVNFAPGGAGTHNFLDQRGWGAGGGGGGIDQFGLGGGSSGNDQTTYAGASGGNGTANFGGGGGGGGSGGLGGSGKVVIRYEA
jgi:hypothetical protein